MWNYSFVSFIQIKDLFCGGWKLKLLQSTRLSEENLLSVEQKSIPTGYLETTVLSKLHFYSRLNCDPNLVSLFFFSSPSLKHVALENEGLGTLPNPSRLALTISLLCVHPVALPQNLS